MASGNKGVGVQVARLVYSRLGQMQLVNAVYAATTAGQHSGKRSGGGRNMGQRAGRYLQICGLGRLSGQGGMGI